MSLTCGGANNCLIGVLVETVLVLADPGAGHTSVIKNNQVTRL